jgi:hypothetical protein
MPNVEARNYSRTQTFVILKAITIKTRVALVENTTCVAYNGTGFLTYLPVITREPGASVFVWHTSSIIHKLLYYFAEKLDVNASVSSVATNFCLYLTS